MAVRLPSLSAIAALEAAARHQSFTKAAAELNLTPGAISHAIRALEQRVGSKLFARSDRRVALTEAGQVLVTRVRLSVSLLGDAFDLSRGSRAERLVISTLPSIASKILIPAFAEVERVVPDTWFELQCSNALATFHGDADVAIRFGPGGWPGVESRHLAGEWLFPIASSDYVQSLRITSVESLRQCRSIGHPQSSWRLWLDPLGFREEDFASRLLVDDALLVIEAAANGLGVGLARSQLVQADLKSARVVRLFDAAVPAEYSYWAIWNGSSPKRRRIEAFVGWVAGLFAAAPYSLSS